MLRNGLFLAITEEDNGKNGLTKSTIAADKHACNVFQDSDTARYIFVGWVLHMHSQFHRLNYMYMYMCTFSLIIIIIQGLDQYNYWVNTICFCNNYTIVVM